MKKIPSRSSTHCREWLRSHPDIAEAPLLDMIASEIEALHRRVQADYDGSDDAIRSFTKGADKNLGGDTKLRKVLKERGNDKNVINQAVTSAKHNLTRLGKVMDLWKKQHRKTEACCATPP